MNDYKKINFKISDRLMIKNQRFIEWNFQELPSLLSLPDRLPDRDYHLY